MKRSLTAPLFLFLLLLTAACGPSQVASVLYDKPTGNFSGCATGAFVNGLENLADFQTMAGKKLAVVLWYIHWQDPFPTADAEQVYRNGSVPMLTWEPWLSHPLGTLEAIAAGSYESYVREFIQAARDWGKPLLLRFAHEMNGNWYPWDGYHNGATDEAAVRYKEAWMHIYNVKEEVGAGNVALVWCPNNTDQPSENWNRAAAYYPGDQYVDWLGMDGYNWGHGNWQDLDAVFSDIYHKLTVLSDKPIMIGEFGAAEQGGNKADWISHGLGGLEAKYPRVKLWCWFNINKERDWRINSSPSAEAVFKNAISVGYFKESLL